MHTTRVNYDSGADSLNDLRIIGSRVPFRYWAGTVLNDELLLAAMTSVRPLQRLPVRRREILRDRLDELVSSFDRRHLTPDPLELVLRYNDPLDQECAALIAAAFAYGRADLVVAHAGDVLTRMGSSPFRYLHDEFSRTEAARRFRGFAHRFHKAPELVVLLAHIAESVRRHGSLGALFQSCYVDSDDDIGPSLARFAESLTSPLDGCAESIAERRAMAYLVSSPRDGSACKRMNLFLRWMVRAEEPDLGLWSFVDPAKLVIPLDTHIHRIATFLGLTERRSPDWKTARSLTDVLAAFNRRDPVRYDYALCRLGILDLCSRKRRKENCDVCLLRDVCRFPVIEERT
jgi:uncharacterized protein (TIGR02757 family)